MRRIGACYVLLVILELLNDALVDSIQLEPLNIIVLVHELDATSDIGDELFLLFARGL